MLNILRSIAGIAKASLAQMRREAFYIKNIMPACQKGRFLHLTHR